MGGTLVRQLQDDIFGQQDPEQEAVDMKAHPIAYHAGSFLPFLISMMGGGQVTKLGREAAAATKALRAGGTATDRGLEALARMKPGSGAARLEGCALAVERIREQLALLSSPDGAWTLAGMADVVSSVEWARAGGPDECPHGYAAGIPCPRCAGGGGS